jgi:polysaccharide biosynthesis protein PslG
MRRLLIVALLATTLISVADAHAAAPRSFYGLISANDPGSSEITRMGAGNVGTLRTNLVWGAVQPTEGAAYDWSHYDAIIGDAAKNGIRLLPTVYSSPDWAANKSNYPPDKAHMDAFRAFVTAAAARYGVNGTFWSEHPEIPRVPVIWWQLWNEVNSPSFWYPKPNAKQYVGLLRLFHDGVTSADPSAKILLAGLFRTPQIKNGIDLDRYLPAIYRRHAKPLFDAAAIHPYATTPGSALQAVKDTRKIMVRFKDRGASLWVTEIGWASGGSPTPLTVSPQRQASYLRKSFGMLAANRGQLHIPGVIWYSWRDVPGGIWFFHTGLFTQDLDPKPAWDAFTRLTGGTP